MRGLFGACALLWCVASCGRGSQPIEASIVTLTIVRDGDGAGVVRSDSGIECGTVCSAQLPRGSRVVVHAAALSGSVVSPSLDPTSCGESCDLTLDDSRTVRVTFLVDPAAAPAAGAGRTVTLWAAGTGSGTIHYGNGNQCGRLCTFVVPTGTHLHLEPFADAASALFDVLVNDSTGAQSALSCAAGCEVVVALDLRISFDFGRANTLTLRVSGGSGELYVFYSHNVGFPDPDLPPSGPLFSCTDVCTFQLPEGGHLAVTAASRYFVAWSGDCTGDALQCSLTLDRDVEVVASFAVSTFKLRVELQGPGLEAMQRMGYTGVIGTPSDWPWQFRLDCPGNCEQDFAAGRTVRLEQRMGSRSLSIHWEGGCSGSGACLVPMTSDQTRILWVDWSWWVRAAIPYGEEGTIVSDAPFTFLGDAYYALLPVGTTFTLTGQSAPGWRFTNWTGLCSGSGSCTITLGNDMVTDSAIANFERAP